MKKQIHLFFAFAFTLAALTTNAQDYYFGAKSASFSLTVQSQYEELDVPIYFHNNTSDTLLMTWKFLADTLTEGWNVGLCDNRNCYYNDNNALYTARETDPIKPYDSIFLKAVFSPKFITGKGSAVVIAEAYLKNAPAGKAAAAAILFRDTLSYFGVATADPNGIHDLSNGENIHIFPIPASTEVFVKGLLPNIDYTIAVMDMQGRVLTSSAIVNKGDAAVDTRQLAAGMYLLRIADEKSRSFAVHTFVKQ